MRVELREPDPRWPSEFERERREIAGAFSTIGPLRIEHIGSTAVAGIRAKPIIDIMVGVASYDIFDEQRARFESLGYTYDARALEDDPGRHVFRKNPDPPRLPINLHFTLVGGPYWTRILAFRDHLRANPQVARDYEILKTELAAQYAEDARGYTRAKGSFVRRIQGLAMGNAANS